MTVKFLKPVGRPRHKFGAVRCERNGKKFPSKLEAKCYSELRERQNKGEILFFLRQVPFDLPGNCKHCIDFCVFFSNGSVEFIEAKGRDLPLGKLKRNQVEEIFGIEVHVVTDVKMLAKIGRNEIS